MTLLRRSILLLLVGSIFCSGVRIKQLPSPRSFIGEGPHWDVKTQSLYYVDIFGLNSTILRYDFNENETYSATVDEEPLITFILPVDGTDDEFLVGTKNAAKVIRWDGKSPKGTLVRTEFEVETNITTNRFNDGKSDPAGRFFGGTMRIAECEGPFNLPNASFYRYDHGKGLKEVKKNVFISKGLTWVTKTNKFHYIDSCRHDVLEFDYDIETGELHNERVIFSLHKDGKAPNYTLDGMTNDTEGNLFVATFKGYKVFKINPSVGEIVATYKFPFSQITSVAFGGPNLDIVFVTTASQGNHPNEAGHLHRITGLGSVGTASVKVKL